MHGPRLWTCGVRPMEVDAAETLSHGLTTCTCILKHTGLLKWTCMCALAWTMHLHPGANVRPMHPGASAFSRCSEHSGYT